MELTFELVLAYNCLSSVSKLNAIIRILDLNQGAFDSGSRTDIIKYIGR